MVNRPQRPPGGRSDDGRDERTGAVAADAELKGHTGTGGDRRCVCPRLGRFGVRVVGRLGRLADGRAQFSGGLANTVKLADLKLERLLERFDEWALAAGAEVGDVERFAPTEVDAAPALELDLAASGITTVLWATGYRPDYSWLDVPVLDYKGRLPHDGG